MDAYPTLPRHTITALLSDGIHSCVYKALSTDGVNVAIKVFKRPRRIHQGFSLDTSIFALRELEVLSGGTHPNLITLHDFGHTLDSGEDYLVFDWVDGKDFVSASRNLSRSHFYSILAQTCRAIHHLHSRGFVHGDLKPHNMLVVPSSQSIQSPPDVRLLDFSYATVAGAGPMLGIQGSPYYLAPEVIQGATPTLESDLYSLGIILYECLAGYPPFLGQDIGSVLKNRILENPPPLPHGSLNELHAIINQLISKDPLKRPHSAAEALRLINAVSPEGDLHLNNIDTWRSSASSCPTIGRSHLLTRVNAFLSEASNPSRATDSRLILVWGERGIGKTRFLRDSALHARGMGFPVHFFNSLSFEEFRRLL